MSKLKFPQSLKKLSRDGRREISQAQRTSCFFISSDVGFPICYETERISNVEILPTETYLLLIVELYGT